MEVFTFFVISSSYSANSGDQSQQELRYAQHTRCTEIDSFEGLGQPCGIADIRPVREEPLGIQPSPPRTVFPRTVIKENIKKLRDLLTVDNGQQLWYLNCQLNISLLRRDLTRSSDPPRGGVATAPGLK